MAVENQCKGVDPSAVLCVDCTMPVSSWGSDCKTIWESLLSQLLLHMNLDDHSIRI